MPKWTAKVWYIKLNDREEGPLSVAELRCHPAVTPDTLVRREGEVEWRPLREVKELADIFQDNENEKPPPKPPIPLEGDELTMDLLEPSPFRFWLLAIIIVLIYTCLYILWQNQ